MKQPFEQIVQAHGLSVLRMCRSLLDEHRAQDAWSETFVAALRAYPDLDPQANVQAWLVRIAHHKAIDELRRYRSEQLQEIPEEDRVALGIGPQGEIENMELWQLVRELPPKQRQVVAYRYLGGLDYQEIAEILGGTAQAARRAATDGIKNLRKRGDLDIFRGER